MSEDRGFESNDTAETHAFLQWKGTDACFDFRCECGTEGHFDGFFAHVVRCHGCGTLWEMPFRLYPRRSQRDPEHGGVVDLEPDEDDETQPQAGDAQGE